MAKRSVQRGVVKVNPMFFIPEGLDEIVYEDENYAVDDTVGLDDADAFDDADGEDESNYSAAPDTPDIFGVIEQIVRTDASGNQVVDLVLDVEDLETGYEYDFKVART